MSLKASLARLICTLVCVGMTTVNAYTITGESWLDNRAPMSINIQGLSFSGASWNSAFAEAAALWNETTNFDLDIQPFRAHACAGYLPLEFPEDGFGNGAAFHSDACGDPFGNGVVAVTLTRLDGNEIIEADVVFNENESWDIYSGPMGSRLDFRRITAHELGHVAGLGHEEVKPSLMASVIDDVEAPTPDDLAGMAILYGDPDAQILVNLEEPVAQGVVSGVSNIRGWALATHGVDRVELYIDAGLVATIPYGGSRGDVGDAFPQFQDADDSGFSMTLAWGLLSPGQHAVTVRVYDRLGEFEDQASSISVAAFANPFIQDPGQIQVGSNLQLINANAIRMVNLSAEGQAYDVTLQWRTESQKFEIIAITPK